MHCSDIDDVLVDYIRGMLERDKETAVREHLRGCPQCSAKVKEYLPMSNLICSMALNEAKAPESHIQAVINMAKKRAPEKSSVDNATPLAKLGEWLQSLFTHPFLPMLAATSIVVVIAGAWILWYVGSGGRQVNFKVVERVNWSSFKGGSEEGIAGLDNVPKLITLSAPLPLSELIALSKNPTKEQTVLLLEIIFHYITRTKEADYSKYQNVLEQLIRQLGKDDVEEQIINVYMERKLSNLLQTSQEEKLMVLIGILKSDKKIMISFRRYGTEG